MKIDLETLAALDGAVIDGMKVKLPQSLSRPLYIKVNKVLGAAGGKWSRSDAAHVFASDPAEVLEQAMMTGQIGNRKQELGIFYTPDKLARKVVEAAEIRPGQSVLEPSAGLGALAKAALSAGAKVCCFDIEEEHVLALKSFGLPTVKADFLQTEPSYPFGLFERIIMNPPFAASADARHVLHAIKWLKPCGRLVAIMSPGINFRTNGPYRELREIVKLDPRHTITSLPPGSFRESGTMVNTVMLVYNKPL